MTAVSVETGVLLRLPAVDLHFHLLLVHPVRFPALCRGTCAFLLMCTLLGSFAGTATQVNLCQRISLAHLNLQRFDLRSFKSLRTLGLFLITSGALIFMKSP